MMVITLKYLNLIMMLENLRFYQIHNLEHLEYQGNPVEENHERVKDTPTVFEVAIRSFEQPPDIHLDNHFRSEQKSDDHVRYESCKLKKRISFECTWRVDTNGNKGSQCTQTKQPSYPCL